MEVSVGGALPPIVVTVKEPGVPTVNVVAGGLMKRRPATSPIAPTDTPPLPLSNAGMLPRSLPSTPLNTRTTGGPPDPGPVMISAGPSLSRSPAATYTPPRKPGSPETKFSSSCRSTPLNTRTCGAAPGPAPVTMSVRPSPLTSPAATRTPPVKPGSNA